MDCLICGGRGLFGLYFQKYNEEIYNVVIGFCAAYNASGDIITFCHVCRDKVWYNDVHRSFLEDVRDRNLTIRHFTEVEMRRLADLKKAKDP